MSDLPSYDALARVERGVLCGLVDEHGTPAYRATYEHGWERGRRTWDAVLRSLAAAAAGAVPETPRATPPRWLAGVARELLADASRSSWARTTFPEARLLERLGLVDLDPDDTYVLALVCAGPDAAWLRADADLTHGALWRVFEVEGGGEVSLANVDRFRRDGSSWTETFVALVADGTLPRDRVLRECLRALRGDFAAYRAAWFLTTYDTLAPTLAEQAAHQDDLRALPRSSVKPTVAAAVRRLRGLSDAGLLADAATVDPLRPAVLAAAKGTALDALRLLDDIARRGTPVVDAVADALDHPHADVQRAAVRLLDRLGAGDVARARAALLEPSVAAALGAAPAAPVSAVPAAVDRPVVRPVTDDLLDRYAALLEDASDAFEVEAVLAAVAALPDPAVLAPLRGRAATVLSRGPREGVTFGWLRGHLARLVLVALREPVGDLPVEPGTEFLVARLAEVAAAVVSGRPFVPLATPDDGWWVSAARLRTATTDRPFDRIAALLRLAPHDRMPGGEGAVAYALGGPPPVGGLADPALWVAAARARAPLAEDPLLAAEGLTGAGRAQPLRAGVTTTPASFTSGGRELQYTKWAVALTDAVADPPIDQPTALAPYRIGWGDEYEDWVGWLATVWPHDAEHFLLSNAWSVLAAADSTMVRHDAVRVLRVLAGHPGRLGPLGYATLAAGLSATRADQRVHAVDAVVALPVDAAALADGMAATASFCVATRWARSLADLALAGRGDLVVATVEALLPRLPYGTKGLHALVETLREESLRRGARPGEAWRAWAAAFPGSSRAARTARALLAD